jgi:hypothetical protein
VPDLPSSDPQGPLRAHSWVVPDEPAPAQGEHDAAAAIETEAEPEVSIEDDRTADEFARRVEDRVRLARYPHSLTRAVFSPTELSAGREIEQQAAVWVPVVTFTVTAVCAVIVVLLASAITGDPGHGRFSEVLVALATVGFLVAGFLTLTRSQDYFDARRPGGRVLRNDLADAYETVRDGAAVLVELGVPPAALTRVADLLPQAERLVDFVVAYEARGGVVRKHPAYDQLILMGAEVTVLTDMAEERLGRRSSRRRDRPVEAEREHSDEGTLTPFDTLADLVAMLGPDVPGPRRPRSGYGL